MPIEEGSSVYKAAEDAINGSDPTNGALYFYNPNKTKNKWLFSLKTSIEIGSLDLHWRIIYVRKIRNKNK